MSMLKLEVLSQAEIETIHAQTLQILDKVGFRVLDGDCRALLARAGARIDRASDTVHLPPQLVEEALAVAPATYEIHRVDGKACTMGGDHRIYSSLVVDPWVIDYETQTPRRPVLNDIYRHTRLGDALELTDAIHLMEMPPADLPPEIAYIRSQETFLTNTTKHIRAYPTSVESTHEWLHLAEILADGHNLSERRLMSLGVAITSPMILSEINYFILKTGVERGLMLFPTVCPMAGTTSPLTFASNVLSANVENVFFIALAQLVKPGARVTHAAGQSLTDLKTGHDIYYNADKMLWKIANIQMGRYYNVPVAGESAGSIVGRYDMQAGIEGALLMLPSIACGQHYFSGLGSNYNACGISAEMIVMQADLAQLLERIAAGIDTSDRMLGYDSIAAAGPGGHFLEDPLTIQMLRSGEFFTGGSFDRLGERSPNDPKDSMLARAHARVEQLLATHEPAVKPAVSEEIHRWAREKEAAIAR
jgi:trimethylamine---corrinoid protein Co-methyltransferase